MVIQERVTGTIHCLSISSVTQKKKHIFIAEVLISP